ncbi:MAG: hypothetical protein APF81_16310 [Desulfosporosinus sp. BRH_c37]|nr:MAG: hypothetical protein APF81_16310 [Desulfosporosinus sp. BRH_c37]
MPVLNVCLSFSQQMAFPENLSQDISTSLEQTLPKSGFSETNLIIFAERRPLSMWTVKNNSKTRHVETHCGNPSANDLAFFLTLGDNKKVISVFPPSQGIEATAEISINQCSDELKIDKMLDRGILIVYRIISILKGYIENDTNLISRTQQMRLCLEIVSILVSPLPLKRAMHAIMQLLVDTFQIRCALFLIDNQERTLIPFVGAGEFNSEARHKFKELNAHKLFPGHLTALSNNKPLIVSPETVTKYFPIEVDKFFKTQWAIMAPIIANDRELGILQVDRDKIINPEVTEMIFLVAKICALIIDNKNLEEKANRSDRIIRNLIDDMMNRTTIPNENVALQFLSHREIEVLSSLTKGLSNKEIAIHLHISNDTVKAHINNIYRKLDVKKRTQAMLKAAEFGIK